MFFFFGISPVQQDLRYNLGGICPRCGKACNYDVMTHGSSFSIFFIPLFTFGKGYFVKTSCCDEIYTLEKELGKRLEQDSLISITESDLTPLHGTGRTYCACPNCGNEVEPDFIHCPTCGTKL